MHTLNATGESMTDIETRLVHVTSGDVSFEALINGDWVPCRISQEALDDRLATAPAPVLTVFAQHEGSIVARARQLHAQATALGNGPFDAKNRLLVLKHHF